MPEKAKEGDTDYEGCGWRKPDTSQTKPTHRQPNQPASEPPHTGGWDNPAMRD